MSAPRLYHPDKLRCGETIELNADASSHLVRVLRTKPGSPVILFNGDGHDYLCTTQDDNVKKTGISIDKKTAGSNESSLNITLLQGLSRQHRMEFTIQKSVELGVNTIIPLLCTRSNTKLVKQQQIKKLEHWRKVAISACEQSGRSVIPAITGFAMPEDVKTLLDNNTLKLVLNPEQGISLKQLDNTRPMAAIENIAVCIGPEGGLTKPETDLFAADGYINIRFGPRILRTETAGPAVISALQALWGDC